ncbi:MAG: ATP-dependent Clp protease proteolytic subunit [Oscillospiraceae bacterium]|nr:ATP-dependent Clp protease proteolytic subunit [Oscillospiraceae bacterium]
MSETADKIEQDREQIQELGVTAVKTSRGTIYTLAIIGQIEGHQILPDNVKTTKYEHVMPLLAGIEENEEISGLLLLLNTVGGDIEAGLAIAELISGMTKPTVSLVLGGGHSIGVPLAVAAQRSMIARSASMTIHPVRMTGLVVGAPQTFEYFNKVQQQIVDFVTAHSKISKEQLVRYMMATGEIATDMGTVLYGREAVECGLISRMGNLSEALECLRRLIEQKKNRAERKKRN